MGEVTAGSSESSAEALTDGYRSSSQRRSRAYLGCTPLGDGLSLSFIPGTVQTPFNVPAARTLETDVLESALETVIGADAKIVVSARCRRLLSGLLAGTFFGVSDRRGSSKPISVEVWVVLDLVQ